MFLPIGWQNKKVAGIQTAVIIHMIAFTAVQIGHRAVAGLPVEVLRQVHRVVAHLRAVVMVVAAVAAVGPVAVGN